MRATTPPISVTDPRISRRLTDEDIRRNAKESELDALIDMRASKQYCIERAELVMTLPSWFNDRFQAYRDGTLDGINEYRQFYMSDEGG